MAIRKVVSSVNRRLPGTGSDFARHLLTQWGKWTAKWRMAPDFLVVGAQRAGTTTLFRVLSEHPQIVRPTTSKGIGYFDDFHINGQRWYRAHFPLRALARIRTRGRALAFESSGYYLFHPLAPERIARELPGVKVVVMVRDPVDRAYSAHRHELRRGFETEDFQTALDLEPGRLAGEEDRMRADARYTSFEHRHHAYVGRSTYANQIQRYIEVLGAHRVLIVDADRFFTEPHAELTTLFNWLGVRPWLPTEVEQWNAQPREPMPDDLRARLENTFLESDSALEQLMGRVPSWRRLADGQP